jgi:ribosomal protein S27E
MSTLDETRLKLDGNAMAGVLQELFVDDVTAARGACASCGTVADVGGQHLYMYPTSPGAVLRCATCENVLIVVVHAKERVRFALCGLAWVEIRRSATV